jgi:hypothetical protein
MSFMRWTGVIAFLLILMMLLAGCGQRVPGKGSNTTTTPLWGGKTVREYNASAEPGTTVTGTPPVGLPTVTGTSGPVAAATIIPTTVQVTPAGTYRNPPPPINITANYTVIFDQSLIFTWNSTAFTYELINPPLIIDYTLTVPNITRTKQAKDPVSGGDITVTSTYPDPMARFEIIVRDPVTMRTFAQDGYGGQYDVSYSKQLRVLYPGKYHIQMSGNKVTAHVKFTVPKGTAVT